jgi:nicotinic acid phosphoribosyltransferase
VEDDALAPFSLVCKAVAANGRPTVKLSDNPEKAMGPEAEIARYKRVFGVGEQERLEVVVSVHRVYQERPMGTGGTICSLRLCYRRLSCF